jgi:hypothetical protein
MTGTHAAVLTRICHIAPQSISRHCMIHREALAAKRFTQIKGEKQTEPNAFEELLHVVVRVINEIRSKTLNTRLSSHCVRVQELTSSHF